MPAPKKKTTPKAPAKRAVKPAAKPGAKTVARPTAKKPAAKTRTKAPAGGKIEEYRVKEEPYYLPTADEVGLFETAYAGLIPVMLKGPTGCGKTRFVEYMAWKLGRPLVTVSCHDDLTASDLVGRYIVKGGETVWIDGPLTMAVRVGGICYLDEIVEARKDTTVVIHPLADKRRMLTIEKRDEVVRAPEGFMLVMSFNPGYQSALKDLKQSTRQRFIGIDFDYPPREHAAKVVAVESGVSKKYAESLVSLGEKIRNLKEQGLEEAASVRLLVYAGQLISAGVKPRRACEVAIANSVSDDAEMQAAIRELIAAVFDR